MTSAPGSGAALPDGWRLRLDPRVRRVGRALLAPTGRLLRLGPDGPAAVAALEAGTADLRARRLGRVLLDAGAAHPVPPPVDPADVTVVVPVRDRLPQLARCLAALAGADVLVVDDGSEDPEAVRALCARHGATVVRRANGGPAAARNTALPLVRGEVVAFLDSDCVPPPGWLAALRGHLADPAVAAVAPRVAGGARSPLDLGLRPGLVVPGGAVSYVPTAALLVRRSALPAFDEALRYGEDVDLVWRLLDGGWRVVYDPSVVVRHEEPATLPERLVRRYRYGTSAAPLSRRHPGRLAHLVLPPWPTAVLALLLARRPVPAAAVAAAWAVRLDRQVHAPALSARLAGRGVAASGLGAGRALALLGPAAWALAVRDRRAAALLLAAPLAEWRRRGRPADPVRFTAAALLDDAAYGAGVLAGCARTGSWEPLRPRC